MAPPNGFRSIRNWSAQPGDRAITNILHTADVHLDPDAPERQEGLEAILAVADDEAVDAVTIGGDLFDSEVAAEELRDSLRELFSDRSYPIITIPGNHDADAFRGNLVFGENFEPATGEPFQHVSIDDGAMRLTCLPYVRQATEELLIALADRKPFDGPEALLVHCSLEVPVSGGVGDESEKRYFPISKEELAELDYEYYFAGHYHTNHRTELSNGGTFVYPGTPTSVTRSETRRRTVALIDTADGRAVRLQPLGTFHYDELRWRVTPGEEDAVIKTIEDRAGTWRDRNVEARIVLDGYTELDEQAFDEAVAEAAGEIPIENRTRTVEHILAHPLFEEFEAALEGREEPVATEERDDYDPETFKADVWEQTLEVFARLSAEGVL